MPATAYTNDGATPPFPDMHTESVLASADTLAGLLLAARTLMHDAGLACPTVADILAVTRAPARRAYAKRAAFLRLTDTRVSIQNPPSRRSGRMARSADTTALTQRVLRYLMDHPGAVSGTPKRRCYSPAFKQFVLGLRCQHPELSQSAFSRAVQVAPAVVTDWKAHVDRYAQTPTRSPMPPEYNPDAIPGSSQIAMIVRAWRRWAGTFSCFCSHVRRDLGIPWHRGVISRVLAARGQRVPVPRRRRHGDAHAPRGAFQTAFPGAQWVTDGTTLNVRLNGECHRFSMQLVVDTDTAANLGIFVGDQEDSRAVVKAFQDAIDTAGAPPLSLLLDQHPCNYGPEVESLGDVVTLIRAAPGRPQTKAHVEGAFGLFSQVMPSIEINADNPRQLARSVLELVVQCWAQTLNHRPRRNRGGLSRAELYQRMRPTAEACDQARAALCERSARSRRIRGARRARRPSVLRSFLQQELDRLGISDPDDYVRSALLGHPVNAVLAGLATYEGKRHAGTLPAGVDGRYLLGIVRRISDADEGMYIASAMWRVRTEARAYALATLATREQAIADAAATIEDRVASLIDEALAAQNSVDQQFWLAAASRAICSAPERMDCLYRQAARRIHAARDIPYRWRLTYVRWLAIETVPVP